jgi:hypothetical protein
LSCFLTFTIHRFCFLAWERFTFAHACRQAIHLRAIFLRVCPSFGSFLLTLLVLLFSS